VFSPSSDVFDLLQKTMGRSNVGNMVDKGTQLTTPIMRIAIALTVGIAIGLVVNHLGVGVPAHAQSVDGQYQMVVASTGDGSIMGYLINVRTGELEFCYARQCVPALHSAQAPTSK
jgi:hypothetical protein